MKKPNGRHQASNHLVGKMILWILIWTKKRTEKCFRSLKSPRWWERVKCYLLFSHFSICLITTINFGARNFENDEQNYERAKVIEFGAYALLFSMNLESWIWNVCLSHFGINNLFNNNQISLFHHIFFYSWNFQFKPWTINHIISISNMDFSEYVFIIFYNAYGTHTHTHRYKIQWLELKTIKCWASFESVECQKSNWKTE